MGDDEDTTGERSLRPSKAERSLDRAAKIDERMKALAAQRDAAIARARTYERKERTRTLIVLGGRTLAMAGPSRPSADAIGYLERAAAELVGDGYAESVESLFAAATIERAMRDWPQRDMHLQRYLLPKDPG